MSGLNKHSPIPLYHQLKDELLRGILGGGWRPGDRLPTENDLAAKFDVSKITVRQAIRELVSLGHVQREQGRGTFVRRPATQQGPRELTGFTEEMRRRGMKATSRVLEQSTVPATAEVAAKLQIQPHDPVFRLCRLRLAEGDPVGLETAHLPLALVPQIAEFAFGSASLYELLHFHYNLRPFQAKETHAAIVVSDADAALLTVPRGSAGLAMERVTCLESGRPIEFVRSVMRGDRYELVLDLKVDLT
jgi:GntR family transcriptional regulator